MCLLLCDAAWSAVHMLCGVCVWGGEGEGGGYFVFVLEQAVPKCSTERPPAGHFAGNLIRRVADSYLAVVSD